MSETATETAPSELARRFEVEAPPVRVEPTPRWIRVRVAETWIGDSRDALLLSTHGPDLMPTYCLAPDAVRTELFEPSANEGNTPAFLVPHDIRVGETVIEGAAMLVESPPEPFAAAAGHWTFTWRDPRLEWYEEALRVYVHARDPRHRVDAIPSERHVRVELENELLAASARPVALFESGLPTRWYLPAEDVRDDLLEASDTVTSCPYKGTASYYSVRAGGRLHRDLAWTYPSPIPELPRIAGLVCFFNEHVDLIIDGERVERPFTPWSFDQKA